MVFLSGTTNRRTNGNLYIEDAPSYLHTEGRDVLVNYSTPLAWIDPDGDTLHVNLRKYSVSTSRIQSLIMSIAKQLDYEIIDYDGSNWWK